ncbi:hypothetical protein IWW35_001163 [Coemansia sp. RSA 1878]|nr:hypothetical protein IWW35_001163 [Coemansia sp. RSA 1878]
MPRHSKNNTASGVFTYAERQMTEYGTRHKRMGLNTKRKFDSCYLCLQTARTPMLCRQGHISCRECVLANIIEQKQAIERAQRAYEEQKEKEQSESTRARQKMEEEEVRTWGRRQVGLEVVARDESAKSVDNVEEKDVRLLEYEDGKRGEVFALRRTHEHAPEPRKAEPKVASFWVPSQTPSATHPIRPPSSQSPQCTASHSHPLKLSHLTRVIFKTDSLGSKLCPSCDRPFHNGTQIDVLRSCGHTTCHSCTRTFVLTSKACFVCQEKVSKKDVLRVDSEGTAFAAAGGQMVASQYTSALQA